MAIQQASRQVIVKTTLGQDVLVLRHMTGSESLSQLFQFDLELFSEDLNISIDELLGTQMTVSLDLPSGGKRHFNGYVTRFAYAGRDGRLATYRATLHPWLWLLTRTADCRIFQQKKVPDIVKDILRENGFGNIDDRLSGSYRQWDYCVQYRETDFDFISRLMEQEGIYYFFTHQDGKHTLVLADSYGAHETLPHYDKVPYFPPDAHGRRERDHIFDWSTQREVESGAYVLDDFNFETPRTSLTATLSKPNPHQEATFEIFDYPGEYTSMAEGDTYSRIRLEELHANYHSAFGEADARGLAAGSLFTLTGHPRREENKEYLIGSVTHTIRSDDYLSASGAGGRENLYLCHFTALDSQIPFRAPRVTPKPVVHGPQTAIVVGMSGEDIWTDKYGRVKVQFHWDRYGKNDENSSCWLRVAQMWAGKQWGAIFIPRIGQEVVVSFLEGDPDCPIITGRVYNGDNMPPYALPANRTQSGVKSRSSTEGGTSNFNELRFEDKKGSEEVFFHAEKDFKREVEHDDSLKVEHDQTIEIKNNRTETVKEGDEKITVEKGNRTVTISTGNETLTIEKGNQTTTIENGNQTTTIENGNQTTKVSVGKAEHEAMQSIELKVGGNSIKIDQTGITIKGMQIKIDGSLQTEVKGGAMVTVKGGVVMIN